MLLVRPLERAGTYGECAWTTPRGGYDAKEPTVARLMAFIDESGYEIAGMHEEWYLPEAKAKAKIPKTAILYPVRRGT